MQQAMAAGSAKHVAMRDLRVKRGLVPHEKDMVALFEKKA